MRRLLSFGLKAVICAGLLYYAVASVNLAVVGERRSDLKIGWMIGALALV